MKYAVGVRGMFYEVRVVEADSQDEAAHEALEGEYQDVLSTEPVEPLEVRSVQEASEFGIPFDTDTTQSGD